MSNALPEKTLAIFAKAANKKLVSELRTAPRVNLLEFPEIKAIKVSDEAGSGEIFGDLSNFNRNFRHRYGATPREVRKSRAR